MKKSDYGILWITALVLFSLLATIQKVPGYMDAEYYFGQGVRIFHQHDLLEPFIWNYLNNPNGLPVPAFSFWLPMTSIFAAGGMWLSGITSFFAAKVLFILMAASVVIMAAFMGFEMLHRRRAGWLAGLLAMFSGFYMPYVTITDTFTPYMFLGGLFFISIRLAEKNMTSGKSQYPWFFSSGILVGLMSLTRSDGLLWLAGGWAGVFLLNKKVHETWKKITISAGLLLIGFLGVMLPWYLHNYSVYHRIFPSGNGLMLWLTQYSDLFVYPTDTITFSRWWGAGIGTLLLDRLNALGTNLQTLVASGGAIILTPLMLIGFWKTRKSIVIRMASMMLLGILILMTFIFPFAGARGGFFHSLSSVQVVLWSLATVGLDVLILWGVKHRHWNIDRSWKMFGIAIVAIVITISLVSFFEKLNYGVENRIPWNKTQESFKLVDKRIVDLTGDKTSTIMVNNPPGYTLATGRMSVMIPSGDAKAIIDVCQRYSADFLVVNGEREEVQKLLTENELLSDHFLLLFETVGNRVYEFNP